MKDGYLLTADYTTTDGASKSGVAINRLSDIGVSFYLLASVTVRATVNADDTVISHVLPVLSDGDKGDRGDDGMAYQVVVTSSAGTVMLSGTWKTVLTATLLRNGVDISDTVSDGSWSWRRLSADMDDDVRWNALHDGIGRICNLSRDDIARQAQFECEVLI